MPAPDAQPRPATASPAALPAALAGAALYADVQRYESFGVHRFDSPGADAALDWIASELAAAGLAVAQQPFTLARQYQLHSASLRLGDQAWPVLPQWWLPDHSASLSLRGRLVSQAPARGDILRVSLPYDQGAYLSPAHHSALAQAFAQQPSAVLLTIGHPSGEIFTYNVAQDDAPWPVPVLLAAPRDSAALDAVEASGQAVQIEVQGQLMHDVPGRNILARLDRGAGRSLVVTTPVTGWHVNTCERGPGIAALLALARIAPLQWPDVDLVFAATAGHEVGHGGMDHFIRHGAPPPGAVLAWAHLGASLAAYGWREAADGAWQPTGQLDAQSRLINSADALTPLVDRHFHGLAGRRLTGAQAAVGELREVQAAGYTRFFGMAGHHRYFHTLVDTSAGTGPDILQPVVQAFADALTEVADGAGAAGGE